MLSFEEAGIVLDEACDNLPPELFEGLNGGVSLQPGAKRDEDGRWIMGLYHHDIMGRWIELFYGSFRAVCAGMTDAEMRRRLEQTLRHELTHHIEGRAGDRTLELQDEMEREEYRADRQIVLFGGGYQGPGSAGHMRRRARPARPFPEEAEDG